MELLWPGKDSPLQTNSLIVTKSTGHGYESGLGYRSCSKTILTSGG